MIRHLTRRTPNDLLPVGTIDRVEDHYPNARILVVDDSVANISLLRNILDRLGYTQVSTLLDSRETIALVGTFRPDLIILDLNMPFLDGLQVMQQLREAIEHDTFLPVLVLTADATAETKIKALVAGASDFLTKPFNSSELFMRIRNLLQLRFLHLRLQTHNQTLELKVSERTRELREMQEQMVAQERLHAFGEMAGGVVHDFNNALMSVVGYSEILLNDDELLRDIDTARKFLQIMNTAGQDASHVIGQLRDFYRPRAATDVFSNVDLNEIIEQVVPLTQPKWKGHALATGRKITVDVDLARIPAIYGNATELREVATNLIFNAVDAMTLGGKILLRSSVQDGQVVFEVSDSGMGMTEEVRAHCLEPFFSTKGEKGTGLGLSMVFGIIKRHEGTVEIDSLLGKGSTFRIRLPIVGKMPGQAVEEDFALGRAVRVLVVDDEAVTRGVLESYLEADGHQVMTAADAGEAAGYFANYDFDLLITDYAMPGMNGLQLASAVRATSVGYPIILVSGFALEGDEVRTPDVNMILRKPVPQRELRRALFSVMRR